MESFNSEDSPVAGAEAMLDAVLSHTRDAVLVIGRGTVLRASGRAVSLLGGDPRGLPVASVLVAPSHGRAEGVAARRPGGREVVVDVESIRLGRGASDDTAPPHLLFLIDAGDRVGRQAAQAERELRRRQALEINDTVVQGLVAAQLGLEQGRLSDVASVLQRTLVDSRGIMDGLLDPYDGVDLGAGDLTRDVASQGASLSLVVRADTDGPPDERVGEEGAGRYRVLVVDDAEDLRMLLCLRMRSRPSLTVVGQAADGVEAVDQARALQPDLVLLDLAMPRMDGLQALPLIKEVAPRARVAVLSGFNQATMQQKALDAGADVYLVKGTEMATLLDSFEHVLAR